ncbi:SURF1 family protein [soil metagenome]
MRAGEGEAGRSTQPRRPRAFTGRGIAAALLVIGITAVCIRLGIWQLDRHAARERLAASLESAAALPPLELTGDSLREVFASAEEYLYRRVRLTGSYEPGSELVLRGRALGGAPGIHIVTPLQLLGESAVVLVNRGWAPSPDAATIDPLQFAEPGSRTLEGILQPIGSGGDTRETRLPVNGRQVRTVQRIDFSAMSAEISPLLPVLVQQLPSLLDPEGSLTRLPVPVVDRGPHLGYALQWFSFAAISVLGFVLMLFLSRRRHS